MESIVQIRYVDLSFLAFVREKFTNVFFLLFDSRLLSRGPLVACLISTMMLPNFLRAA